MEDTTSKDNSSTVTVQKKSVMIWSEDMDLSMLKEVGAEGVMTKKAKSRDRGIAWQTVASHLNEQSEFEVCARSVRDRFNNLVKKHKARILREERASGEGGEVLKEWESLLEELMTIGDETDRKADEDNLVKKEMVEQEREKALEMRKRAMETMGETRKTQGNGNGNEKKRRSANQMEDWLEKMMENKRNMVEEERKVQSEERKVRADQFKAQQENYDMFLKEIHQNQMQQNAQFRATEQLMLQQQQQQSQQVAMIQQQMLFMMEEQKKQNQLMFEFLQKSEK